jgi:hypothetical protein
MAIDLSDYNTVPERIAEAKAQYPEGRFTSEVVPLFGALADRFVAVKAKFYRHGDDTQPGEGLAWEPVPGLTPYTKNSELQNAETSAWGRALIACLIADAKKGIASREEVRNRRDETVEMIDNARNQTDRDRTCPDCGSDLYDNRDRNRERIANDQKPMPAFKCSNKSCRGNRGEPWIAWEANYFDDFDGLIVDRGTGEIVEPPVARDDYGPDEAPF